MTVSLGFYTDAGLTTPLSGLVVIQAADNSLPAVDRVVYLGSTVSGNQFQATSDPGVDPIMLSIADAGSGILTSYVKLALSSGGLNTAVAGDPLDVGDTLLSGSANSLAVHIRVDLPAYAIGSYSNLSFETDELIETEV